VLEYASVHKGQSHAVMIADSAALWNMLLLQKAAARRWAGRRSIERARLTGGPDQRAGRGLTGPPDTGRDSPSDVCADAARPAKTATCVSRKSGTKNAGISTQGNIDLLTRIRPSLGRDGAPDIARLPHWSYV
jgi:hypothetical protein